MATKKPKESPAKPLVNHRWHLPSVGEILDRFLPPWPEGRHPDFSGPDGYQKMRGAFEAFADHLLSRLELTLEKAAGRGIEEALRLIRDPEYHKTITRRTKKEIDQWKEKVAQQDRWRERWKRCEFSQAERLQEIGRITYQLKYHQTQLDELNARKKLVESGTVLLEEPEPQPESMKSRVVHYGDNDEWPEFFASDDQEDS